MWWNLSPPRLGPLKEESSPSGGCLGDEIMHQMWKYDSSGGKQKQRGQVSAQPEDSRHLPVPCPCLLPTLLPALRIELWSRSLPQLPGSLYLVPDFFFSPAPPSYIWNNWEVTWGLYLLGRFITEPAALWKVRSLSLMAFRGNWMAVPQRHPGHLCMAVEVNPDQGR